MPLSFKGYVSFLKGSLLKTPVGHNPISTFQSLVSPLGGVQTSPTERKIVVPCSRAMGCFWNPKLKRKECITPINSLAWAFAVLCKGKTDCADSISPFPPRCWTAACLTHHCTDTCTTSITSLSAGSRHRWPASHSLLPASFMSINLNLAVWAMFNHKQFWTCSRT